MTPEEEQKHYEWLVWHYGSEDSPEWLDERCSCATSKYEPNHFHDPSCEMYEAQ
jgi:hypothetical protein